MERDWKNYNKLTQKYLDSSSIQAVHTLFQIRSQTTEPSTTNVTEEKFHFDHLPDNPKDLPQGLVIVLDSTGMKLTNIGMIVECYREY